MKTFGIIFPLILPIPSMLPKIQGNSKQHVFQHFSGFVRTDQTFSFSFLHTEPARLRLRRVATWQYVALCIFDIFFAQPRWGATHCNTSCRRRDFFDFFCRRQMFFGAFPLGTFWRSNLGPAALGSEVGCGWGLPPAPPAPGGADFYTVKIILVQKSPNT